MTATRSIVVLGRGALAHDVAGALLAQDAAGAPDPRDRSAAPRDAARVVSVISIRSGRTGESSDPFGHSRMHGGETSTHGDESPMRGHDLSIDPTSPACSRVLAELLQTSAPSTLAVLAFSESPVTPTSPWLADAALADAVVAALDRHVQLGGQPPALLMLTSTAVYGVASGSPLVFDECSSLPHENVFLSAAARWAQGLRDVEKKLVLWAVQHGAGIGVLRTASVMGTSHRRAAPAAASARDPRAAPAVSSLQRGVFPGARAGLPPGVMDSPWAALLRAPLPLRVLGYDPPCQVIHYDDLVTAIALAIDQGCGEVLNIVGRSVVPLSRLLALAGVVAPALPGPLADRLAPGAVDGQRLRWRNLADGRRATELLGFRPTYTVEDCLRAAS